MLDVPNSFLPSVSDPVLDEAVGTRSVFYRLGESEIFEYANKNTTINGSKMIDVIPRMVLTDHGFLQLRLDQFEKTVKYELFESARFRISCKKQMMQMLDGGKVNMVYSEEYKLPTALPYIIQGSGSKAKVFVNITDFVEINKFGQIIVTQPRNYNGLMAVLFAACAAYAIVNYTNSLPADLADGMVTMYANMMEKVINSLIHMDPISREKIRYLCTEFALIQMYGTEEGTRLFYRHKQNSFPKLSKLITDSIDSNFKLDHFDKLSLFIDEMRDNYPSMKGLNMTTVYEKWVRSYGASTALSIDYIGYHLYTICMVLFESPLVTRMALEPVLDKSRGADMYKRLQGMIEY